MNILAVVAQIIDRLKKKKNYKRTYVQKIVYFLLDKDERERLYEAYLYGPYSSEVQEFIQFFEDDSFRKSKIDQLSLSGSKLDEDIDKIINFIKDNNLSANDFSKIAKLHFIKENLSSFNKENYLGKITAKAEFYGWSDSFRNKNIKSLNKRLEEVLRILGKLN